MCLLVCCICVLLPSALDPVNYYLSFSLYVYGLVSVYSLMHVLDYVLDGLSGLFRFNRYSLVEKACLCCWFKP